MIKVENIDVWGFEHAVRGMRNPMNSWDKSDSRFDVQTYWDDNDELEAEFYPAILGDNDLDLMKKLYKAGTEHRKYLRQIMVSLDITAPLYWWKEFDTYKVGTVSNSCSTMHKIAAKEFELDDFSHEHIDGQKITARTFYEEFATWDVLNLIIKCLNWNRREYLETKDKKYWWQMIQLLPSSYNQRRTITMNYENVFNIIHQRAGHKLDEWREFVNVLKDLPYVKEIMEDEDGNS
jgi:hypothetical protein